MESNSYQDYYVLLDCSSFVYYESLQITVQFTNATQPLYFDIGKNTLQIGDSNYTHIIGSEHNVSFYLDKDDDLRSIAGAIYLRVGVPCTLCSGNITVTRVHDCSFHLLISFVDEIIPLYYSHEYSWNSKNLSTAQYYGIWVPEKGTEKPKSITVKLTNLTYYWTSVVASPITIHYMFGASLENFNLVDSSVNSKTIVYSQYATIHIDSVVTGKWLLIAIRTDQTSSGIISGFVEMEPYLVNPGTPMISDLNPYQTDFRCHIFLYTTTYTPITVSASVDASDVSL